MDLPNLKRYLVARAQESSTWRGIVLIFTAAGMHLAPDMQDVIIAVGLSISGVVGAAFPDEK